MWLFNSSIGRKFVMAVTGACLVLFVTFHVLMNSVALIWPGAYNQVCEFLGANWYALIASAGLAALFIIHIVYAVWLTLQNRRARGNDRYEVTTRPPQVEWASKNMLVLGIVILAFLVVHLIQFWAKMQWQELRHADLSVLPQLEGIPVQPAQGTLFIQMAFSQVWTPIVYIIGFIALWFHMNHGFWSMFQSAGWNGMSWLPRLKKISCWWTSIVIALFIAQAIVFTVQAHGKYYLNDENLKAQYAETFAKAAEKELNDFETGESKFISENQEAVTSNDQIKIQELQRQILETLGTKFVDNAQALLDAYQKLCTGVVPPREIQELSNLSQQVKMAIDHMNAPAAPAAPAATEAPVNPDAVQGMPEDMPPMPEKVTDDSQPNQQPK